MNTALVIEIVSMIIILAGFIGAIVFFIMARSQGDMSQKKRLDRKAIWSFLGPLLLVVLGRLIWGMYITSMK